MGQKLREYIKVKSLGLIVDEKPNLSDYLKLLEEKVAAALSSMKQLKNSLPQSQLCSVFKALVESHIRYANVI